MSYWNDLCYYTFKFTAPMVISLIKYNGTSKAFNKRNHLPSLTWLCWTFHSPCYPMPWQIQPSSALPNPNPSPTVLFELCCASYILRQNNCAFHSLLGTVSLYCQPQTSSQPCSLVASIKLTKSHTFLTANFFWSQGPCLFLVGLHLKIKWRSYKKKKKERKKRFIEMKKKSKKKLVFQS